MKIGIGLPASVPGVSSTLVLDWAKRAEQRGFSSLGMVDRIVYPNYEAMMTFAACAAVTTRIRLMTTVLLEPLRHPGILAKQAATLDVLSNCRLTLGLGIGTREDDFLAAPASFHDRGKRFERDLQWMKKIWSGERLSDEIGPVGPRPVQPGGPELLIGGYSEKAIRRAAQYAGGYISGGIADTTRISEMYRTVEQAWQSQGRPGKPRLVGAIYCALGTRERAGEYLRSYYGPRAEGMVQGMPLTREAIKERIQAFSKVGADELMLWATIPELDQVDGLAELLANSIE